MCVWHIHSALCRTTPIPVQLLGAKLKASGMPITIMAGVQAELKTMTMPMPGR